MDALTRFRALFRAREDVWAEGYPAPDNPNKYRYVKVLSPLNADVLREHLAGETCVGVYPILEDSSVWWFAFDFDGDTFETAFEQAKAQRRRLEDAGFITYIERSRSGLGCHLWGFLDEALPAEVVRAVLKPLVLSAYTFDRMYPVQDFLSDFRPLGNLIALPYFGLATDKGNSTFVSDDGTPLGMDAFLGDALVNSATVFRDMHAQLPAATTTRERTAPIDPATDFRPERPITGALKLISPYGCKFMRHAWVNRKTLSEPEWYAALGQASVFRHGRQFARLLSRDYPGYDEGTTDAKFEQALQHPPVGCKYIHEHFPEFACDKCPMKAPYHTADKGIMELVVQTGQRLDHIGSFSDDLDRIERLSKGIEVAGIEWPIKGIDKFTRFRRGELTVIGANPSVGKTALMVDLAVGLARTGVPVFVFSAETGAQSLRNRLLANVAGVDSRKLGGEIPLEDLDWPKLAVAASTLEDLPIYIDYASISPDAVLRQIEEAVLKAEIPLDTHYVVFFDYLQFGAKLATDQSEYDRVTRLSTEFKFAAKILDQSLVVFSQLKREAEGQEPAITDFKNSGRIEQDLDVGIIITGERVMGQRAPRRLTIVKQREGMANVAVDYMLEQPTCRWLPHVGAVSHGTSILDA